MISLWQGRCVVAGGWDDERDTVSSVEWYCPRADTWSRMGRLWTPRDSAQLAVSSPHPGANLKSISHRCHPILEAFVWELTEETIDLPRGCLQGGLVS